jgi:hypothetical protein
MSSAAHLGAEMFIVKSCRCLVTSWPLAHFVSAVCCHPWSLRKRHCTRFLFYIPVDVLVKGWGVQSRR